ncbi:MAG: hypothetical protein EXR71_04310 [Myxococcales bacterium]|nr:hypothetical protein [Myxococcales bacterium]
MLFFLTLVATVFPAFAGAILVGTAQLPADGTTTSEVRVYVERCPDLARARVKAEAGKVSAVTTSPDCVVTFNYTPPEVPAPTTLPVSVQVQADEYTVQVPVAPVFAGDVAITFDPPVLQVGGAATVKLKPSGTSPVALNSRRFVVTASVGTIDVPIPLGDGTWSARYTAPKTLTAPVMVAITAADASAPGIQGWAGLPVTLRKSVSFDAQAGSQNVLNVGGKQYGPLLADSKNKVAFEIHLDPRYPTGRLQSINPDTSKVDKDVPIPSVPQQGQLAFLPLPASFAADAGRTLPIRVVAFAPNGNTVLAPGLQMTASAGAVSAPAADGKASLATFTPGAAGEVTLGANWNGMVTSRKLKVLAPLPNMTIAADPPEFPKGGGTVKIVARLKDANGVALAGRAPSIIADGGSISGKLVDNKDGSYSIGVTGSSKTERARVYGTPPMGVSALAPARILAWAGSPSVTGNGLDSTSLTLVAVDAYDLPVPGIEFRLAVPKGDGVLPPSVTADARGIAHAVYKAGTTAGLATVQVDAAGLSVGLPIFQVGKKMFLSLEPGGPAAYKAALDRWQHASPALTIVRAGVIPPSGPPADMQISTTPGFTTPGAAILVQVYVADQTGVGVTGQKLQIGAPPATVGGISDSRDGHYTFSVQLPAGKDGPLKITVAAGTAIASLELPTLEQAGGARASATVVADSKSAAGGGGFRGGRSSGGSTTKVARSGNGEPARGRLGAGLVNLRGPYELASDGGGGLANATTEAPGAGFYGVVLGGDFGLPVGPGRMKLDAFARFSANIYTVNGDPFLVFTRDITAGGRYLHGVADGLSVGGGLDLQSLSAPYYTYTDEARTAAQLGIGDWFGMRLVAELNVDLPSDLHVAIDLAETFAWVPAGTHVGALVDIPLGSAPVALRTGIAWDFHYLPTTALGGEGHIDEHIMTLQLGAVYVLH